jgi:hypothetical protein
MNPMSTSEPRWLLVEVTMDAFLDWRRTCVDVREAYDRWSNAPGEELGSAFAAYLTALDSEEDASVVYAELLRRMRQTDPVPVVRVGARQRSSAGRRPL